MPAEIFRTFAAPDPNRYYQFARNGDIITVTEYRVDDRIRELERTISSHEAALDLASALLSGDHKTEIVTTAGGEPAAEDVSGYAILVVDDEGEEEYLCDGVGNWPTRFSSRSAAKEYVDLLKIGLEGDVQSINVVPYPK